MSEWRGLHNPECHAQRHPASPHDTAICMTCGGDGCYHERPCYCCLKAEVERLTAALDEQALILKAHTEALADQDRRTEAVRELHKPEEGCGHCWAEDHDQPDPYPHARWALILCDECGDRWPCLTIRALDGDA